MLKESADGGIVSTQTFAYWTRSEGYETTQSKEEFIQRLQVGSECGNTKMVKSVTQKSYHCCVIEHQQSSQPKLYSEVTNVGHSRINAQLITRFTFTHYDVLLTQSKTCPFHFMQ